MIPSLNEIEIWAKQAIYGPLDSKGLIFEGESMKEKESSSERISPSVVVP